MVLKIISKLASWRCKEFASLLTITISCSIFCLIFSTRINDKFLYKPILDRLSKIYLFYPWRVNFGYALCQSLTRIKSSLAPNRGELRSIPAHYVEKRREECVQLCSRYFHSRLPSPWALPVCSAPAVLIHLDTGFLKIWEINLECI